MGEMLYFYYGEDSYSLKNKIKEIIDAFVKIEGSDFNVSVIYGNKITVQEFEKNVFTAPFLGNKRLIIVKNVLGECPDLEIKKALGRNLDKIPETSIVVFAEGTDPDKRESLFKTLLKTATVTNFAKPADIDIKKFVQCQVSDNGLSIDPKATSKLALYCGADYWRIENELSKLIYFAKYQQRSLILEKDVEDLVDPINNFKIFDLTDSMADRNVNRAIKIYYSMLKGGEDEIKVFNMIIYHIRNMVIINSLAGKAENQIAQLTALHPYVVKKILSSLRKFEAGKVQQIYKRLSELDWKIKRGLMSTGIAIDLLLVDFQRN